MATLTALASSHSPTARATKVTSREAASRAKASSCLHRALCTRERSRSETPMSLSQAFEDDPHLSDRSQDDRFHGVGRMTLPEGHSHEGEYR